MDPSGINWKVIARLHLEVMLHEIEAKANQSGDGRDWAFYEYRRLVQDRKLEFSEEHFDELVFNTAWEGGKQVFHSGFTPLGTPRAGTPFNLTPKTPHRKFRTPNNNA